MKRIIANTFLHLGWMLWGQECDCGHFPNLNKQARWFERKFSDDNEFLFQAGRMFVDLGTWVDDLFEKDPDNTYIVVYHDTDDNHPSWTRVGCDTPEQARDMADDPWVGKIYGVVDVTDFPIREDCADARFAFDHLNMEYRR